LIVRFERRPIRLAWGATWSVMCGALAAWPWDLGVHVLARTVAAWFVAVPLAGAIWLAWLLPPMPAGLASDPHASTASGGPGGPGTVPADGVRRTWHRARDRTDAVLGLVLAVVIAALLGPPVLTLLLGGLAVFALTQRLPRLPPHGRGLVRSATEIGWPGAIAWLALDGAQGVPASLAVAGSVLDVAVRWWQANWLFPLLLALFTVGHFAVTVGDNPSIDMGFRRRLLGPVYVGAVAALAVADHPWGAGAVALTFVVQWPFQVMLAARHAHRQVVAIQGLAMVAMLVAALGAAVAG